MIPDLPVQVPSWLVLLSLFLILGVGGALLFFVGPSLRVPEHWHGWRERIRPRAPAERVPV